MKAATMLALLTIVLLPSILRAEEPDVQAVARITGLQPEVKDGIVTVKVPRKDLGVVADGVTLDPFQGLTSWAAFQQVGNQTMVMGDLTLSEEEVNAAMSAALENGLEVTALHNHFSSDRPHVFFMHIGGMGTTEQLAGGLRRALDAIAAVEKPKGASHEGAGGVAISASAGKNTLDAKALEAILGPSNATKDGMVKFVFGRKTTRHGVEVGALMGVNTWATFAGTPEAAVVDGDFAMLPGEVQGVLKVLRRAGISIVAIHNHTIDEEPRLVFLHYWGRGAADSLARNIRAALDTQQK